MPPPSSSSDSRRKRPRSTATAPPAAARDWAALLPDILYAVFLKLGSRQIMTSGADRVCTSWRRVAVGEPSLWRRIDMTILPVSHLRWRAMLHVAMGRSAGQCEAFSLSGRDCDDATLQLLVQRAPSLKSLRLLNCVLTHVHVAIWKKLPLLEHLEASLSIFHSFSLDKHFHAVCEACPRLKKLSMRFLIWRWNFYHADDVKVHDGLLNCPIPMMHELRSLQLLCNDLSVEKLMAILDKCPVLESLEISDRISGEKVEELKARYAPLKILMSSSNYYWLK